MPLNLLDVGVLELEATAQKSQQKATEVMTSSLQSSVVIDSSTDSTKVPLNFSDVFGKGPLHGRASAPAVINATPHLSHQKRVFIPISEKPEEEMSPPMTSSFARAASQTPKLPTREPTPSKLSPLVPLDRVKVSCLSNCPSFSIFILAFSLGSDVFYDLIKDNKENKADIRLINQDMRHAMDQFKQSGFLNLDSQDYFFNKCHDGAAREDVAIKETKKRCNTPADRIEFFREFKYGRLTADLHNQPSFHHMLSRFIKSFDLSQKIKMFELPKNQLVLTNDLAKKIEINKSTTCIAMVRAEGWSPTDSEQTFPEEIIRVDRREFNLKAVVVHYKSEKGIFPWLYLFEKGRIFFYNTTAEKPLYVLDEPSQFFFSYKKTLEPQTVPPKRYDSFIFSWHIKNLMQSSSMLIYEKRKTS